MGSIRRHRNAMTALLAEYTDKPLHALDTTDDFDDYLFTKRRREDNDVQGGLCQSIVRYARPQKARSASGEWKYIVNTGQHTQTLRLEKCMNPQESCSYLASNYRSHCSQVYNYHRLLSWDKMRGLHVDIFKVPTCCSCQIDGYKQQFPALTASKNREFTPAFKGNLYRHHQEREFEEDEEPDVDDDDFDFALQRHHQHDSSFDANELLLSSNRVRSKVPSPTVGSYLSPPGSEVYEPQYAYKSQRDTASAKIKQPSSSSSSSSSSQSSNTNFSRELARRRPQKSFNDNRSDLEYSPSEQHAERELTPAVAALATAALRPSQQVPEPFVPSPQQHYHRQQQQQSHTPDVPLQIPMPTKSHQLQEQQQYQQRSPTDQQYHHYHHPQSVQQHYRPIITPGQEMSSKTNQGYVYHTRSLQPIQGPATASKRPIQRIRQSTSRRHRSSRMFML